jgi:hypothetical protein
MVISVKATLYVPTDYQCKEIILEQAEASREDDEDRSHRYGSPLSFGSVLYWNQDLRSRQARVKALVPSQLLRSSVSLLCDDYFAAQRAMNKADNRSILAK